MKNGGTLLNFWRSLTARKSRASTRSPGLGKVRRSLAVIFVSVFLVVASPPPAQALPCYDDFWTAFICFDIGKLLAWVGQAAVWLAEKAAAAAAYLEQHLESEMKVVMPIVSQQLEAHLKAASEQAVVDAKRRAAEKESSGDAAAESLYPPLGQACSLTRAGQEAASAEAITNQTTADLAAISASRGAGVNADANSPAYIAVGVNERCKLGFIDTSPTGPYGNLPTTMGCTNLTLLNPAYARFIDADTRLSSVIGRLQYPLPAASRVNANTPDGHMSFMSGSTPVTPTETAPGLGSEMDYAAAYKFCENLQPTIPTPTHSDGTPNTKDVASIIADRKASALRTAAAEECFRALAYRTSCPQGSESSMASSDGSASCHKAQQKLCARLTDTHANGGLELAMEGGNPLFSAALTACKDNEEGISQAMYDAIMAHRCDDRNFAYNVLPNIMGSPTAAEHARAFECQEMKDKYAKNMELEKRRMNRVIGMSMRLSKGSK